jgi:exodeoxyribonuclease VII small subunit
MMEFEQALSRLEEIIEQLSVGKLTLKESVKLYEEAVKLVALCRKELSASEKKIEILRKDLEGQMTSESASPSDFGASEPEIEETAEEEGEDSSSGRIF